MIYTTKQSITLTCDLCKKRHVVVSDTNCLTHAINVCVSSGWTTVRGYKGKLLNKCPACLMRQNEGQRLLINRAKKKAATGQFKSAAERFIASRQQ